MAQTPLPLRAPAPVIRVSLLTSAHEPNSSSRASVKSRPRFCTAVIPGTVLYPSEIIVLIQRPVTVHSSVVDIGRYFSTYFTCRCGSATPVTVSFYFSSIMKLRFVNCCTNKRIWMNEVSQKVRHVLMPQQAITLQRRRHSGGGGDVRERRWDSVQQNHTKRPAFATILPARPLRNTVYNTEGEVTSPNLWSQYDRHFVGVARHNAFS